MKTSFAVAAFSLLASALAAPYTPDNHQSNFAHITFSVANDISGANVQRTVPADGTISTLGHLFAGTALANAEGHVIATSAQLNTVIQGVFCIFKDQAGVPAGLLNERITFTGLDGVEDKSIETDVTGFTFECQQ